ncbi:protein-export chaperone SecB [Mucilaginibacter terrae]|uniref:protein-export chaperone SecB n=1 Tax=Mucilaginibacter terrae TaxID=1955052 RepID=UPI003629BE06
MASENSTLTYQGFEVIKILHDRGDLDISDKGGDFRVNVKYLCNVNNDSHNDFLIVFIVTITHTVSATFNFQVEAFGKFNINGEPESTVYYNLTEISAPSIVYPYLRAFISNVAIQSGLEPIFIPALNFAQRREDIIRSDSSDL